MAEVKRRFSSPVAIAGAGISALAGGVLTGASLTSIMIAAGAPSWLRAPFRLICHGIPERSYELAGVAMPICGRCAGVYAGMIAGVLVAILVVAIARAPVPGVLALLLVVPLAIDGSAQAVGIWSTGNAARTATGILGGMGFIVWVMTRIQAPDARESRLDARGPSIG